MYGVWGRVFAGGRQQLQKVVGGIMHLVVGGGGIMTHGCIGRGTLFFPLPTSPTVSWCSACALKWNKIEQNRSWYLAKRIQSIIQAKQTRMKTMLTSGEQDAGRAASAQPEPQGAEPQGGFCKRQTQAYYQRWPRKQWNTKSLILITNLSKMQINKPMIRNQDYDHTELAPYLPQLLLVIAGAVRNIF